MDKYASQKNAHQYLYPQITPFDQQMLDVGGGHRVYFEQCGNPSGIPVVILHGGPGGGCSPSMRRYFDPQVYRIILFDQRGCGRSTPHASVENNTTWHLVADIERIRRVLSIKEWIVFGGSWGATLSLIYAITHAECVKHLVLRGVFLMAKAELDWFYNGGVSRFWPDLWGDFTSIIPENEHDDFVAAYHKRLFSGVKETEVKYARAWAKWENALASIQSNGPVGESNSDYAHAFARLENHYFVNKGFLPEDDWIMNNLDQISHIPTTIVQGRYDMVCPPNSAWKVAKALPKGNIHMIPMAGHALSEPEITRALVQVMNKLRR